MAPPKKGGYILFAEEIRDELELEAGHRLNMDQLVARASARWSVSLHSLFIYLFVMWKERLFFLPPRRGFWGGLLARSPKPPTFTFMLTEWTTYYRDKLLKTKCRK